MSVKTLPFLMSIALYLIFSPMSCLQLNRLDNVM